MDRKHSKVICFASRPPARPPHSMTRTMVQVLVLTPGPGPPLAGPGAGPGPRYSFKENHGIESEMGPYGSMWSHIKTGRSHMDQDHY